MVIKSISAAVVLGVVLKFTGLGDALVIGVATEYVVERAAANVNENPPQIDGDDLRFKAATARGSVLSMELESSNVLARALRGKEAQAQLTQSMNRHACTDRKLSKLIRNGVHYEVVVETRRGKSVITMLFDESTCG